MSSHTPPVHRSTRRRRLGTLPLVAVCAVAACVTLAACGSSGSGSSSSAKSSSTSASGPGGAGSSRFTQLRSCMQKAGITLPTPPAGAKPGSGAPGGTRSNRRRSFQLPKGVTQSQFRAALKKCGGEAFARGRGAFNSLSARAGLVKFAACLRQNGIDVPAPNTTGKGPVFSTKGIDTSSSKFTAAQRKCRGDLTGAFAPGARAGAPPAGGPGGAPPTGAGAPPNEGLAG